MKKNPSPVKPLRVSRSVPARHPVGAWPAEMKADVTAAFFDFETTGRLMEAVQREEAPKPSATRVYNGRRVPVWSRAACEAFIERRHDLGHHVPLDGILVSGVSNGVELA
jgi:hypothetical protein